MYKSHERFCTSGTDLHAQSVLVNKISASELRRKFIKSALLLVGKHNFFNLKKKVFLTYDYKLDAANS